MFNHRYLRTGPLGEESFYSVELKERRHIVAAVIYVVRSRLARDFHVARKQLERCLPCR